MTISWGSMTGNGILGWYLWMPAVATLRGVIARGNEGPCDTSLDGDATRAVSSACQIVRAIADKSDRIRRAADGPPACIWDPEV